MAEIDYFYTLLSPWAYLGHRALLRLAAEHGAKVRHRPVMLGKVFANSGAVPLAQRPQARQDYRFLELQRWRARRGLPLNLKPKHFPTNPGLADRTVIALAAAGQDPGDWAERVFQACWVEDLDIADRETLANLLSSCGHDAAQVLADAESEVVVERYAANTADAVRLNAIGSPTYVLHGEAFWGQDRLDLLADALTSGREPYRVPG
jgi:2-hydroxychromene-2-carboxylate isomerase